MLSPTLSRTLLSAPFALWLGMVAGCSSDSHPEHEAMVSIPDYPTAMTGTENFAGGKLVAEVTLGLPDHFRPGKDGSSKGSSSGGGGGHHRGGGGGHRGGGGMGGYGGEPGGGGSSSDESEDGTPRPRMVGSTLPPAQIKLHLKNTTTGESIACEVVDFNSSLGNFAVYPSTYKIEAAQSATSETMTSRLGVEGSAIPVTVGVRVNGGEVERKVVTLHLLDSAEKPPEPLLRQNN